MKSKVVFAVFTIVGCFVGSALIVGQAPAQGQAPAGQGAGRGGAPQGPVLCQGTPAFAAQQTANAAAAAAAAAAQQAAAAAAGAQGGGAGGRAGGGAPGGAPGGGGGRVGGAPGAGGGAPGARGGAPAAAAAGGGRGAPAPAREVTITAIPGIVAASAKWIHVWEGPGNNSDGAVALADGSLLIAQEDTSTVLKIDKDDRTSIYLADTHGAGSLSIDAQGRIWAVQRMPNGAGATAPGAATMAGIAILHPAAERKVVNTFSDGTPWTGRPNDLAADGKGGAYFTQGCVYYAGPDGRIKLVGEDVRTNGIVLSPDGKTLYVTDGGMLAAFDVQPDGSLKNKRDFETGGMGGDGSAVDSAGNVYISGGNDIKVVSAQGKALGLIPTPRGTISVAFGGPDRKWLYIISNGASDAFGTPVANPNQPAFAAWRTIYKIQMLSAGLKNRGK